METFKITGEVKASPNADSIIYDPPSKHLFSFNTDSGNVTVIDPKTMQVVDTFAVGSNPQHAVPSWDLKTLWVANNAEGRRDPQ